MSNTEELIRQAVSRAVPETLKSMFGTEAKAFDPDSPLTQYIKPEIQALVGFEGSHQGMMVVRLPEERPVPSRGLSSAKPMTK